MAAMLLISTLVACSDDGGGSASDRAVVTEPPTTPTTAPVTTTATAAATTGLANPAATTPTVTVAGGRRVTWLNVTFILPTAWQDQRGARDFAAGPRIYDFRGYAMGRLNGMAGFDASIDDLVPKACLRQASDVAVEPPSAVALVESGFAPLGDRTAEFRRWSATCKAGVEEHRAWVLPVSRLAFYEVCHDNDTVAVATTAMVVPTPTPAPANRPPWSNEIPGSCRNDLTDSATGT